ncbi:MAG TPA: hypothetical protein VFN61_12985 [Acidimicrobiales bacterium]|nr:hypothetical protein [Acidimicrobiales bacterium]
MGNGFTVDYDGLRTFGQGLANLRGEFSAGEDAISPLLATLSDGGLRSALKSFVDNWSDERRKLDADLDRAAGFAVEAAAVYDRTDTTMGSSYRSAP